MTQCERIIRHLNDHGSINPAEAMEQYGIYRLSARIADLKAQGYNITSKIEKGKNRYDEAVHYAVYRLEDNNGFNRI